MSHGTVIAATLFLAFLIFITARGELGKYIQLLV